MSKGDVLALVATLSNQMADPVATESYYNDVCVELARENWFAEAALITLTRGQVQVNLHDSVTGPVVNYLGLIYDDTELEPVPLRLMEAIDPQWRDAIQYTRSYIIEDERSKVVALHPAPFVASNPNLGSFGEPFGLDLPTYNLAFFYSYAPIAPQAPFYYLELAMALRILALEFGRESDHTDVEYAQAAQALTDLCKGLLA
jgi:hypothetical protein